MQVLAALAIASSMTGAPGLAVDDTTDDVIKASGNTRLSLSQTSQAATIDAGANLEVVGADSGSVTFNGTTGTLILDHSTAFTGQIINLTGDGNSLSSDQIDLKDIAFGPGTTVSYAGDLSGGTLTINDAQNRTANLSLVGNYTNSSFTLSSDGLGGTLVIDPPMPGDGSANAPAGTPQLPNLLNGEAVRPPWMVAGVDYAVGVPAGTVLKNPAIDQLPAGCTYDATNHEVRVFGNNIVLDGWNFSGVNVYISSSTNTTIKNSTFESGGTTTGIIQTDKYSSGLTLTNNVFDGGGALVNGELLYLIGGGNITLEYNLFKNLPAQPTSIIGNSNLNMQYNVFENGAMVAPNHLNFLQFAGSSNSVTVEFNTVYQQVQASSGEGFQFYSNVGGTLNGATVAYNTMIADPTNSLAVVRQNNHAYNIGDVITVPGVKGYFFCTAAGTSASSVPSAETGFTMAQFGVTFSDGTAKFIGNSQAMSYMLHGSGAYATTTTLTAPAQLYQNYFDPRGAYGVFYANSFPGWTISNNVDMATGKIIQVSNSEVSPTTVTGPLPQSDQGPGLNVVAPDGVSTRRVKAVPCSTAARETDGSTTCVGIPAKRAKARNRG